jgi:hypothetical protein
MSRYRVVPEGSQGERGRLKGSAAQKTPGTA